MQLTALNRIMIRLRFRHISLLVALANNPNISACAKQLNMSQPTASKLLREIEEIFGVQLFIRNRRGLTPTKPGLALMRRAEILLSETQASHDELLAILRGATARLRLGVFPVAISGFLPNFYRKLQEFWPGIEVSITEGVEHELLEKLDEGKIDCAIGRVIPEKLTTSLRHLALYSEPTAIVCGTKNPAHHLSGEALKQTLQEAQWVLPALDGAIFNIIASRLTSLTLPPPQVSVETTSVFATIELLEASSLLGVLPLNVAISYASLQKIALVNMPPLHSNYPMGITFRADSQHSPLIRSVLQIARKTADKGEEVSY